MHVKRLQLKKLFNTRDIGGMPTTDGNRIRKGKLIRSGKLYKLPDKTVAAIKAMGVKTVIDLRIYTEIEEAPDDVIEGVTYVHLPVLCTVTPGITREKTMRKTMELESMRIKTEFGTADNYMIAMYKNILFSEEPKSYLKQALRLIVDNDGCILWHCSGGKDRAGILAMLVESLLGVSEKLVIQDYAASRKFQRLRFFWNRLGLVIAPVRLDFKKILFGMMAAKPKYMEETVNEINRRYGSVTEYCKKELDISDEDVQTLRRKYLEPIR